MNLLELRKRLSPSNFILKSAPVMLGATLLVSSSCSNVKEFVNRSDDDSNKSHAIASDEGVEHAYTAKKAKKNSEEDFVKLLEHKMSQPKVTKTSSVQEKLAAGKDPFIEEDQTHSNSQPEAEPQPTLAKKKTPQVLDLASLSEPQNTPDVPQSEVKQANDWTLAETTSEKLEPRPFIDSEVKTVSAEEPIQQKPEVTAAVETQIAEAPVDAPRPFVISEDKTGEEKSAPAPEVAITPQESLVENETPHQQVEVETTEEAPPIEKVVSAKPPLESETETKADPTPERKNEMLVDASTPAVVQGSEVPPSIATDEPVQQTSNEFCPAPTAVPHLATQPQTPSPSPYLAQSSMYPAPEITGDEYIHDGGDSGTKVYYSDYARFGLDVEDTIAEYDDDVGVAHVKPSTRATIYAPKFAAVRTASQPFTDVKVVKLAGHQDQRKMAGIETKQVFDEKTRNDEAVAIRLRSRLSGVEGTAAETSVHQNVTLQRHVKLLNAYEEIRFFREGQLARLNVAVIGDSIAAALDWNGDLGVNIFAHDYAGQEVQGRFTAQDYTVVEDRSTPGDLTIVKVVDKKVAKPGEVLTFTIRFDNTGDRPLRNIRIVDNLSPRLAYVEQSVDSDLDGKLDTEDNGRGSQILTFTFDTELKGHTGGWVSFKCKVR